jgi:hypothetical protein
VVLVVQKVATEQLYFRASWISSSQSSRHLCSTFFWDPERGRSTKGLTHLTAQNFSTTGLILIPLLQQAAAPRDSVSFHHGNTPQHPGTQSHSTITIRRRTQGLSLIPSWQYAAAPRDSVSLHHYNTPQHPGTQSRFTVITGRSAKGLSLTQLLQKAGAPRDSVSPHCYNNAQCQGTQPHPTAATNTRKVGNGNK